MNQPALSTSSASSQGSSTSASFDHHRQTTAKQVRAYRAVSKEQSHQTLTAAAAFDEKGLSGHSSQPANPANAKIGRRRSSQQQHQQSGADEFAEPVLPTDRIRRAVKNKQQQLEKSPAVEYQQKTTTADLPKHEALAKESPIENERRVAAGDVPHSPATGK